MSDLASIIQGYIPTITNHKSGKAKVVYAAFKGGTTKDLMEAHCVSTVEEAYAIARSRCNGIWDLPSATPLDGNCELVADQ